MLSCSSLQKEGNKLWSAIGLRTGPAAAPPTCQIPKSQIADPRTSEIGDVHTGTSTKIWPLSGQPTLTKEKNAYTLAESKAASNCSCEAAMSKPKKAGKTGF